MKKLKIESLYKIIFLIIINLIIKNYIIFIISFIFLLIDNKNNILLFILLYALSFILNINKYDYIKIGFVDYSNDNYSIVNKILYKTKVYNKLDVGDVIYFCESSNTNNKENDLINNIKYTYNGNTKIIFTNHFKKYINKYIKNSKYKDVYKKIYYNQSNYDDDSINFEYISYNLAFYYLLLLIYKKNKNIALYLSIIYSLLFGFQIKFLLIYINYVLSYTNFKSFNLISIKIYIISLINIYLLRNYSFLISIILSISANTIFKNEKYIIAFMQSILFKEINLIYILFYKYLLFLKIFILFLSSISLLFNNFEYIFIKILTILNRLFEIINISIRGEVNIFIILIFIFVIKKYKIKNNYIKFITFIIIFIIPINLLFTYVDFIDVGQGDSILIKDCTCNKNILIDTGSVYNFYKLKKELYKNRIYNIDYLIITHNDNDHNGNIDNLKKYFNIKEIITIGKDIKTKSLYFKYLPLPLKDNDNDNSLVYLLEIDNYKILFTGDVSKENENNIIHKNNINDIDILKVAHHGSKYSSSKYFIGSIKPEIAVISTSGQYNHPSKDVIDILNMYNVKTFITKNDGSIKFYFNNLIDFIKLSNNRFVIIKK